MPNTPADPATDYANGVASGDIIAGPNVRAACARHLRDIDEQKTTGLTWDADAAQRAMDFFPDILQLTGGEHEGKPFHLHDWQAFVVGSIFGWKRGDNRRFNTAYIETGKGSGKSPLGAAIAIYMTVADKEPRSEAYMAATDKDQAAIPFRDAVAMIKLSDELSDEFTLSGGDGKEWNAAHVSSGSWIRPISSESQGRGKSGYRPHFVLLDEVHEHATDAMVVFMQKNFKGRRQPLTVMITNSGVDRTSVCYYYHEYCARIMSEESNDKNESIFAYICGVDDGEDPFEDEADPELGYPVSWAKANPSIGVTFPVSYLEDEVLKSRGMPSTESATRRFNFCQWVDADNPWIDGVRWRSCEVDTLPDMAGQSPIVGIAIDLSEKLDLTAAARVRRGEGDMLYAELKFYTPGETMVQRERTDRVPYSAWVKSGHLIAVPGSTIDYQYVARDLAKWISEPDVSFAFDPWKMAKFKEAMDKEGLEWWQYKGPAGRAGIGTRMISHGQGHGGGASDKLLWMPRSIIETEDAILQGRLKVLRNPVLAYCSASAVIDMDDAGNKKWSKRKSLGRIDGIVALSMAIGCVMNENESEPAGVFIFGGGDDSMTQETESEW